MRPNVEFCVKKIDEALQMGHENWIEKASARNYLASLHAEIERLQGIIEHYQTRGVTR
jgi:hypothetical protein